MFILTLSLSLSQCGCKDVSLHSKEIRIQTAGAFKRERKKKLAAEEIMKKRGKDTFIDHQSPCVSIYMALVCLV